MGLLGLLVGAALAGDGPWTLGPREHNVFVGADYYRYSKLDPGEGEARDLPSPLTAAGLTLDWTLGLREGVEAEIKIPYESVRADNEESSGCTSGPAGWCSPTAGLGDVGANVKVRLVNELYGSPVSVAANAGFRSGEAYAKTRGRLTTLGDGQTDVGGGLSVGRTDVLGPGWYRVSAAGGYWYRFSNSELEGEKVPADEVAGSVSLLIAPHPSFALGPAAHGFWRLGGQDIDEVGADDFAWPDLSASLAAAQVQVGLKLGLFAQKGGPTFSLTVLRTAYAKNNPADTLVLSAGLGWFFKGRTPDA